MAGLAIRSPRAEDSALARRAADGDGEAFAELYERHESRAFNLCYRVLGSRDDAADATQEAFLGVLRRLPQLADRDFAFGSYLLTSARNASYDLIARRRRTQPSDEIPEAAAPVGGDPEDDPERNILLEAQTEEIRLANLTLPERQREVLALRELEELSYDEIAELMEMNRNSVAQLISRARINLRDALRGTALASIAASSPDCERALPLIALEQDGQLDEDSNDAGWLGEHLMRCHTCRLGRDAMQEAGVSYRAWAPVAAGPLLFRETMAQAAELVGADWSDVVARRGARARWNRRRDLALVATLTLVLALVVLVAAAGDENAVVAPEEPAVASEEQPSSTGADAAARPEKKAAKKEGERRRRRSSRRRAGGSAGAGPPVDAAAGPAPEASEPEPRPRRRRRGNREDARPRPDRGGQGEVERRPERGGQEEVTPEVTPEPPPPTTPEPPPPPPPPPATPPEQPPERPPPPPCSGPNCPRPPPP